jgi:predicted lipoprotein with Yx(FWY)xxD motif
MRRRDVTRLLAVLAVGALVLAACGGDDDDSAGGANAPTSTSASSGDTSSSAAATNTVNIAKTKLGDTLVDANGMTLYAFKADSNGKSVCNAGCDATWPPLTPAGGKLTLAAGLDAEDFKIITRNDGSKQVTDYGQPLYTFARDTKPGDTNGDGFGGVWYAVGKDGKAVNAGASAASTTTTPPTTASAYGY